MSAPIYSPGLEGVIAGETAISCIAGGLQYRGYAIEDLAEAASFEEVAYLILQGDLPNGGELAAFREDMAAAAKLPDEVVQALGLLPSSADMMDAMRTTASLLASWDEEAGDNSRAANLRKSIRLLAKLPVAMAARQRIRTGMSPVAYDPELSLAGNVLWMLRDEKPSARQTQAMNVTLVLYAEHEYNASAFTSRVIASTLSDMHSAISGAIGALKGPLHGGANERVMEVLASIGTPENAEPWIRAALANKERIMGFGHRVYKEGDPRAKYLKRLCQEVSKETGHTDMEQMSDTIETIVWDEKRIPPNLDWPSARLYHYLGLPVDLYTPLFVVSRVVGWCAHVMEQHDNNRIIRPRSRYTGPQDRRYVPLEQR